MKEIETFCPESQSEWRKWLKKNHQSKESVLLILYKKNSGKPVIGWSGAVDEALCFGWVDSVRRPLDGDRFIQLFTKRKPKGTWSKINKEKVKRLSAEGLMMQAGLDCIERAKKNGSWTILDDVEEVKIPPDLSKAFKSSAGSKEFFMSLSRSVKKQMLQWVALAKRAETRQKRIDEIVEHAKQKQRPIQFR